MKPDPTSQIFEYSFFIIKFCLLLRVHKRCLVDELGGITIYNPNTFTSLHGNYYFKEGDVTLNVSRVSMPLIYTVKGSMAVSTVSAVLVLGAS